MPVKVCKRMCTIAFMQVRGSSVCCINSTFLFLTGGRDHFPQGLQPIWVQEMIDESRRSKDKSRIRGLPRTPEELGYALDSSDFWSTFGLFPEVPWVD
jgi:hypothetical protein